MHGPSLFNVVPICPKAITNNKHDLIYKIYVSNYIRICYLTLFLYIFFNIKYFNSKNTII